MTGRTIEELREAWSYEFDSWSEGFENSPPVKLIASEDNSDGYDMDRIHVLKLANGKFAFVKESGCSCYSASDAHIELFPTQRLAMEAFARG